MRLSDTPRVFAAWAALLLILAQPASSRAEQPTIEDEVKQIREGLRMRKGSGVYIQKHAAERLTAWRAAAEKGSAEAQWLLSRCYLQGAGVEQDLKLAIEWMRKSADQKFALAQNNLGLLYSDGVGVEADHEVAVALFRKAADQREPAAQYNLGQLYENGEGVDQDVKEAIQWYGRAARQNFVAALEALGELYEFGRGVKVDGKEAAQWYRKASELGDGLATAKLLGLYEDGKGVEKDAAEVKRLRELVRKQLGDEADAVLQKVAAREIRGTWRIEVRNGKERHIVTLTLGDEQEGQLYVMRPDEDNDNAGRLHVYGLAYRVERTPEGKALVLDRCGGLLDNKARIEFAPDGKQLRLKGGKAIREKDDMEGIDLKGRWSAQSTDRPYGGIVVRPGGVLLFNRFSKK